MSDEAIGAHDPSGWWFLVTKGRDRWIGLAKHEPFLAGGHIINEPGDVWFEFGGTAAEALDAIKRSVGVA